jgi:hypothetical protein
MQGDWPQSKNMMPNNDLRRMVPRPDRFAVQPYKPKYDFTISARKPTLSTGRQSFFPPQEGRLARAFGHLGR